MMEITWEEITQGLGAQVGFCAGYSDLYQALFEWLYEAAGQHSNQEPSISAWAADFGRVIEAAWSGRAISGALEASLLLAGSVHAAVLSDEGSGRALRAYYATAGGSFDIQNDTSDLRAGLEALFNNPPQTLIWFLREGRIQTNEVSRSAAWLLTAYALQAWQPDLSLTLVDLGTAAGLNLAADYMGWAWALDDKTFRLNPDQDPIQQRIHLEDTQNPDMGAAFGGETLAPLNIHGRVGIDKYPLNAFDPDSQLMLQACIWGDQPERLKRFDLALAAYQRALDSEDAPRLYTGDISEAARLLPRMLPQNIKAPHLLLVYNSAVTVYFNDNAYAHLRTQIIQTLSQLPPDVVGIWLEAEAPRYNETAERPYHFMIKARLPFMGGVSSFFLGELEAHPTNIYLRSGWDNLRLLLDW